MSETQSEFVPDQTHIQTIGPLLRQVHELGFDASAVVAVRRAYGLATELWAVNFQSSGRPFLCHAVGTASVVARHGGSLTAILAALLHATYHGGDLGVRIGGAWRWRRQRVQRVIGVEPEALVHRFYELARKFDTAWDGILNDGDASNLSATDRSVLLIRICNDLDDITDYPHSSSTRRKRIEDFCRGSIVVADALGESELAELLREAYAGRAVGDYESTEIRERHRSGYIVVPRAFSKRIIPAALEVAHRLWTTGTIRP